MADGKGAGNKRMRRREIERRRAQTRKVLIPAIAVAVAAAGLAAAIMLTPPPPPPHEMGPGEIVSRNPMHIHAQLSILNVGEPMTIPSNIGIQGGTWADHSLDHYLDLNEGNVGQLSPLHTHDASGLIHVEASVTRGFTLGEFFAVWGQPLGPSQTMNFRADANHRLTLTVNGVEVPNTDGDWRDVVLKDAQQIVIRYIAS